jgi:glycosyltransferase involved in cell wall biosynthesis
LPAVLDAPAAHEWNLRVIAEEAPAVGIEPPRVFSSTARIRRERALADYVVSPSAVVTACLRENGVDAEKIVETPFGVDHRTFTPASERPSRFVLLCVSSINLRKGTRYLLQAWRELSLPDAELWLAGTPDAYGATLLREHAGTFRWLRQVPRADLPSLYRSASAFALPSLCEGSALATYEAMAAGLPVIATGACGAVASDGVDGMVVAPRDVPALKEAIALLYARPALREQLGHAARATIERAYTWEHYHARIAALHLAVAEGRDPQIAVRAVEHENARDRQAAAA